MKGKQIVLFFLIDALGWEIIRGRSFLDDLATCRKSVKTILGFSSAAIPTILTGKYPDQHGRWNLLFRSPETSPFRWTRPLHLLPPPLLENRVTRKIINVATKRMIKADGYFSGYVPTDKLMHFDICEKYNIYRPGGIPGSETIIDYLVKSRVPHRVFSYHDASDVGIFQAMEQELQTTDAEVYFCYLPEVDAFLHSNCHRQDAITDKLKWYENHILRCIRLAEDRGAKVRWFVFSDHGMTPITRHYDLIGDLRKQGVDLERDCLAVFDSTMARFWTDDMSVRGRILAALEQCPAGHILTDAERERHHLRFTDDRYGQIIYLMDPGTLIFPNLFGTYEPSGMHGFSPEDQHSYGVYVSNTVDYDPHEIIDLYTMMRREVDRIRV